MRTREAEAIKDADDRHREKQEVEQLKEQIMKEGHLSSGLDVQAEVQRRMGFPPSGQTPNPSLPGGLATNSISIQFAFFITNH